ncbi:DoxX family protein [Streptomycetaceae bacterium NBC_01309]
MLVPRHDSSLCVAHIRVPFAGIAAWLAVVAAAGLCLVQIGGMTLHLSRGEVREIGLNITLLLLAGAAVWLGTVWI